MNKRLTMLHTDSYIKTADVKPAVKESVFDYSMERIDQLIQQKRNQFTDVLLQKQPHTPLWLVDQLTDGLYGEYKLTDKTMSILVVYTVEWAINLRMRGFVNVTFITNDYDPFIQKLLTKFGINYKISKEVKKMRFDVGVGNPPFSAPKEGKTAGKRAEELYPKFFAQTLAMCDIVAMVLPTTDQKVQKKHNDLLKEHANFIAPIDTAHFPGIAMDMWYVICNKDDDRVTHNISWALDGAGNTIPWKKGSINMTAFKDLTGGHGDAAPKFDTDITVYHKVNNTSDLVVVYAREEHVTARQRFPDSGYAVLLPQTFSDNGWTQTAIVKCNGRQAAFNGMTVVFTDTKAQATALIDHMKTPGFIAEGNRVKQGFNNMNLTSLRSVKTDFTL